MDKFIIAIIKYSEIGKINVNRLKAVIEIFSLFTIQILITIATMILFGISLDPIGVYIAAFFGKFIGEFLKKSSDRHPL